MKDKDIREPAEHSEAEDREFAERIAKPMRAPESLDITFEARVMAAVQAESSARRASAARRPALLQWLLQPRALRVSPLRAFAAAAALVAVTVLGTQGWSRWLAQDRVARTDTVHVVRFVLVEPQARAVSLVGDFNGWKKGATPLTAGAAGSWVISIPLSAGRHEYAFIVEGAEGQRWVADPFAATVRDEFDTESSIIMVGNVSTSSQRRSAS